MKRMWLPDVAGSPVIQFYSEQQLALERPRFGNSTGRPRHYTIFNTQLELLPTPDHDYVLEIVYRKSLPHLSDDNPTNWVLTLAPDLYLYGALCHAAQYLSEPERFAQWSQYYDIAMDDLTHHGRNFKYGGAPVAITLAGENTP